jgi:predicted SprT family Zn-dependent metalloprotease
MNDTTPTSEAYNPLQYAFDYFNRTLFNSELPHCVLTLRHHRKSLGYFHASQFSVDGNTTDEIALNAEMFALRTTKQTLSTIVHEMNHLWQQHFGKPSFDGHHNREWAAKMQSIGLMPSNTGLPGGKPIGKRMTHYVIEGGPFDLAAEALLGTGFEIKVVERPNGKLVARKSASKTKFTCQSCGSNAWGKPELRILCGDCKKLMTGEP